MLQPHPSPCPTRLQADRACGLLNNAVRRWPHALAATAILLGASAFAPDEPQVRPVSYRDLDLSTEVGARTALKRIRKAAQAVCRDELIHQPDIEPGRSYRNCRDATVRAAVRSIGSEPLSRLVARNGAAQPGSAP